MQPSRSTSMARPPTALTIAGSDASAGAGVQADLKTFEALGVYGTTAITALTAQNTQGVRAVEGMTPGFVAAQVRAVVEDVGADAVKTGMLGSADIVAAVARVVREHDLPLVVDPVMVAQSGDALAEAGLERALRDRLLPEAVVVTPNAMEAEALTGESFATEKDAHRVLQRLRETGARNVLLKGGHLDAGADTVTDWLLDEAGAVHAYRKPRLASRAGHGGGCTLSAAVAAGLANGLSVKDAVDAAERFMERAFRLAPDVGRGRSPLGHLEGLRRDAARWRARQDDKA